MQEIQDLGVSEREFDTGRKGGGKCRIYAETTYLPAGAADTKRDIAIEISKDKSFDTKDTQVLYLGQQRTFSYWKAPPIPFTIPGGPVQILAESEGDCEAELMICGSGNSIPRIWVGKTAVPAEMVCVPLVSIGNVAPWNYPNTRVVTVTPPAFISVTAPTGAEGQVLLRVTKRTTFGMLITTVPEKFWMRVRAGSQPLVATKVRVEWL